MIVPFTYNILKRHPALMCLIHRNDVTDDYTGTTIFVIFTYCHLTNSPDPFDAKEENPTLTKAIDSSLWELYSQRRHYHSTVSTMARIFEEAFTKPSYSMEDFLDHTYATVSWTASIGKTP